MPNHHNLDVWHLAHQTTLDVYRITRAFPVEERYWLVAQLRRASASIAANVAEGSGRGSDGDFARFVAMARASANEVEYHALLAGTSATSTRSGGGRWSPGLGS